MFLIISESHECCDSFHCINLSRITVLVGLYEEPEKPNNALDFLRQHMGTEGPETADVESLKLEVTDLQRKLEAVSEENNELKARVSHRYLLRCTRLH